MNRILVVFAFLSILLSGCASEKTPAEPTPNQQAQLQSKLDMEQWLLDARYSQHLCNTGSGMIADTFEDQTVPDPRLAAAAIIELFKKPGGLLETLDKLGLKMKSEEIRLDTVPEKDIRIFESLKRINLLTSDFVQLLSKIPESTEEFSANQNKIDGQLSSLVKILTIEYPQLEDEFSAKISEENLEYRSLMKMLQDIPKPQATAETALSQDESLPTPTPTTPPIKTWKDKNGVIHMGYAPPENAEVIELQSQLSGSVEVSEVTPSETETTQSSKSMIWVDENGASHMGHVVPEGADAKPADEIPLMIGK